MQTLISPLLENTIQTDVVETKVIQADIAQADTAQVNIGLAEHPVRIDVVHPTGHINAANAVYLQQQLLEAVSVAQSALLVDMSQVESIDSAGLMALVSALTQAQQSKKQFGLCSLSPSIRIIFELTQLDRAFKIFDDYAAYQAELA